MSQKALGAAIIFLIFVIFFQSTIQYKFFSRWESATGKTSEDSLYIDGKLKAQKHIGLVNFADRGTSKVDPAKPSTEEIGLFLESKGLPCILAKDAWVYGKAVHAIMETGNNPRSGALATDHALTSWSNICVMRLTRKYRLDPEVVSQFFALIHSNNPALNP